MHRRASPLCVPGLIPRPGMMRISSLQAREHLIGRGLDEAGTLSACGSESSQDDEVPRYPRPSRGGIASPRSVYSGRVA